MSSISLGDLAFYLSPDGQTELVALVREARDGGPAMLDDLREEFPWIAELLDLVANHDSNTAFDKLKAKYKKLPIWLFETSLKNLHGRLRFEIDRPRDM